jgi:hypothetical protein
MTSGEVIVSSVGMLCRAEVFLILFTFVIVVLLVAFKRFGVFISVFDLFISHEGSIRLEVESIFIYLSLNFLHPLDAKIEGTYSDWLRVVTFIKVHTIERSQDWRLRSTVLAKFGWLS